MGESVRIVLLCVLAAAVYGIVHDQFTVRICLEYFTVFHPPVFATQSPTLLAIGWGIIATWWVGAFLGLLLAIAARAGKRPLLTAGHLVRPVCKLLLVMGTCATVSGILGFVLARRGMILTPEWMAFHLSTSGQYRFMADWWAHSASYVSGFVGGIALCVMTFRRRNQAQDVSE
jgi:hypothetical protein